MAHYPEMLRGQERRGVERGNLFEVMTDTRMFDDYSGFAFPS